ncbi:MAG TPA: bifunctional diguanylate cyclase/phosphodiesterase [Bryobacteraceae bacterium]|jgi:diguanylate cyclase (GGDEF)-like protein|nr:bifunctional diguanylate cyclase/phosphodiesterase [Bryobacteraceae bacterium]
MAARLDPRAGVALLLLENDCLILAAEHGLKPADQEMLRGLRESVTATSLLHWGKTHGLRLRPLLTEVGESLGALVLFPPDVFIPLAISDEQLDEISWMATLAIEQMHLSEDLVYRAHHDPLTHLWNRTRMEEEIDRTLATGSSSVGLILLALDRFRIINDVLGYQVGNELLRQVAVRLADNLSEGYCLARSGGDEFMILIPQLLSHDEAAARAQLLLATFSAPFQIGDHELVVRATAGSSVGLPGKTSAADLESWASIALRHSKARSRGRVSSFQPSMIRIPPERLVMEQHLRFALQKREFVLHYQPQIAIKTGRVTGLEALLRWNHPSLGFISPATFVPLAEEMGLIEDIGDWVLEEAILQLQRWRMQGLDDVRMSVNVSPLQFSRHNFASSVAQKLRRFNMEPASIELEITEGAVMNDFEHALRQMRTLRSLGIRLAVDDFGTGHSSLAYLRTLPVHRLKVDRMFVKDIVDATQSHPLLASITHMAHALNLSVIAEGVETEAQIRAIRDSGCEEVQGFYYSKPLPASDTLPWIEQQHKAHAPAA